MMLPKIVYKKDTSLSPFCLFSHRILQLFRSHVLIIITHIISEDLDSYFMKAITLDISKASDEVWHMESLDEFSQLSRLSFQIGYMKVVVMASFLGPMTSMQASSPTTLPLWPYPLSPLD